jgi:ABC-type polysaccharide/polyol phosphate transport system ATPase subunit
MTTTVNFHHISKKYQLGLTRTSLPSLAAQWAKRVSRRSPRNASSDPEFWALRDVSFELESGESLALVGANGAGKTTILKLLANITKPTSGSLSTRGQLSALIELGAGFHPDLTGRENIYLNGTILGLSRKTIADRFDEIVDFSELEQFIDTPVKRYSSGMIVRLGFAVASCINPDILLVDEVLAVGDASFQQKCLKRIHSLITHGTSILFVSHNFYLVQAVCSTALYLKKGQVKHYGATKDVIDLYEQDLHHERAQKFFVSPSEASNQGEHIEITKVEVLDQDGIQPEVYLSRQPVQLRIHFNAYRSLGKIQASVFVIRSDGMTCCMMRTKLDDFELVVNKGQGCLTLLLQPLQVITGTYFAEAWFLNDGDSMVITPNPGRSDWFSVKGAGLSYEENSGVFEPNTQWTVTNDTAVSSS